MNSGVQSISVTSFEGPDISAGLCKFRFLAERTIASLFMSVPPLSLCGCTAASIERAEEVDNLFATPLLIFRRQPSLSRTELCQELYSEFRLLTFDN
jgi:hypothetical protein